MEEESASMEVETSPNLIQQNNNNININHKRFGLKNSIQTNFGDDYVFQIVPKDDWTAMAVSLSTNAVKLYSPVTGQFYGECNGHDGTVNQISFSGPSHCSPHVLYSCSSDSTIRAWDTRSFREVSCIAAGPGQEVFSFDFGGSSDNLFAAGCKSQIIFWDWRNTRQVACLEESHTEDVTQVHFVPNNHNKLVSASVDGLICVFGTEGDINDDEHLESVINVETSIGRVGFVGETCQKLWCLTHVETLSVWDWTDGRNYVNFQDARALASNSWSLGHVDYFVDCYQSGEYLWVIGGTNGGTIGYFPISDRVGGLGSPEAILVGGHTGIVRSLLPMSSLYGGQAHSQGIFGWTGGEDGRLCCWLSDDSPETNRSWISSGLVYRSPKDRKKNRHQPY